MHGLKGNWIGQTFAHAKFNDSGEKRSRIRRSKEERKAMVESFIKKHQVLNSGSFPSLNLTHKEVGGSFYTVREIIREIIQENKVLGPAKLTQGGESQENILEHYPVGSIAIQPEIDSLSLDAAENELHEKPNYAYNLSEEHPFNTNLEFDESERWMFADNENISTSSLLMEKHAYEDEAEVNEILEMETMLEVSVVSEGETNVREILTTRKTLEDSITSEGEATATTMDAQMGKEMEKLEALAAEVAGKELEVVGESEASKDGVNILTKEKNVAVENVPEVKEAKFTSIASDLNVETFPVPVSNTIHGRDDITVTPEQDFDEDDEMSFTKSPIPSQEEVTHLEDKSSVQESEEAHMGISNGYASRNDHFVDSSSKSDHEDKSALHVEIKPFSKEEAVNLQSSYPKITHGGGNTEKENTPTLDRINLESWEGTPKKSLVQQINAPLAFMKAIIATFIKFWTE